MNILNEKSWGKCSKQFYIISIILIIVIMIVRIPNRGPPLEHKGPCDIEQSTFSDFDKSFPFVSRAVGTNSVDLILNFLWNFI